MRDDPTNSRAVKKPEPALEQPCYHGGMKEAVAPLAKQPGTSPRKARTKKHIVVPLTAEQISRGVGVTKKDAAIVTKVLSELGYIKAEKGKAPKRKVRRTPTGEMLRGLLPKG